MFQIVSEGKEYQVEEIFVVDPETNGLHEIDTCNSISKEELEIIKNCLESYPKP